MRGGRAEEADAAGGKTRETPDEPASRAREARPPKAARLARAAAALAEAPAAAVWTRACGWIAVHGAPADALPQAARRLAEQACATAALSAGSFSGGGAGERGFAWAAAAPLRGGTGAPAGALCVFDRKTRRLGPETGAALEDLGWLMEADAADEAADDAGREARRLRTLFDAILDNTEALVFIKRRNGELVAANRMYRLKALRDSVAGVTDDELYGPATGAVLRANDSAVFETGEPFYGEERVMLPGGDEAIYLSSKFLVRDPAIGEPVLCAIATDITEQKALQARLETSRREAEAANVAKSEFLAAMSHEIRTPMNGVLGMLALLANTELSEKQRRMATVARDSAANLLGLLNDILDYARIATGRAPPTMAPFNLRAVLAAGVAPHRDAARAKGLSIAERVDPGAPGLVVGDAARFRQVLGALVSNAVKFTERGAVSVEAGVAPAGPGWPDPMLRVSVRDTGVGVPEPARERIFLGFAQGDGSHTRRYGGVGLGLSISKLIVEGMGGAIGFESVEGHGATFWFTLPLDGGAATIAAQGGNGTGATAQGAAARRA